MTLERQLARTGGTAGGPFSAGMGRASAATKAFGATAAFTGRQLQYSFTIPLLLAAGAGAKFALDNEKAMTRVVKVYGDGTEAANQLAKTEIPALGRAFRALSDHFGVAQDDAINIAADWAAAGASGIALAKSVKLTMETMILGELEAVDATQQLIAIQAQYGLSIDELSKSIDVLNMVENQTGISMQGLMEGMARSAGVARSAGIDVEHLAAMMAALVPAAGSAANAGNALKTMISRVLSPTGEAADVMREMGIELDQMAWKSLNGAQRLELLATKFDGLDDSQKAVVSSVVASRWQINRFDVLMKDIINTNGYYQKSLRATSDEVRNYNQRQRELNAVLSSNPQRLKQVWVIIQNAMADVIQPLLPMIVYLAQQISKLFTGFSELSPAIQKLALALLLMLALVGPLLRYIDAFGRLFLLLGNFVKFATAPLFVLGQVLWWLVKAPFALIGKGLMFIGTSLFGLIGKIITFRTTLAPLMATMRLIFWPLAAGMVIVVNFITGLLMAAMPVIARILGALPAIFAVVTRNVMAVLRLMIPLMITFGRTMLLVWGTFLFGMSRLTRTLLPALLAVWRTFFIALQAMIGTFAAAARIMWAAMHLGWYTTSVTFRVLFVELFKILFVTLGALFVAFGKTIALLMQFAYRTIAALTVGFWATMRAITVAAMGAMRVIWTAGVVALWAFVRTPAVAAAIWSAGLTLMGMILSAAMVSMGLIMKLGMVLLASPWTYVVLAILGILYTFKDQLVGVWDSVVEGAQSAVQMFLGSFEGIGNFFGKIGDGITAAFNRLPSGVRDAMMAVVRIVHAAAMAVYDLFSYLNPFAHHSPSLVENVNNGMAAVRAGFDSVNTGNLFARAKADMAEFKALTAGLGSGSFDAERSDVAEVRPQALASFDRLVGTLGQLNNALEAQGAVVDRQQATVTHWQDQLDGANMALKEQERRLDALKDAAATLNDEYERHEEALEAFASAPLVGMGAMSDQIFENEMAQKRLRLEMLKMGEGGGVEAMRDQLAALAGDIETLQAQASDLRSAGAGSDVLGPIQAEIDSMEAQARAMREAANSGSNSVSAMEAELAALQRQGEILDLENSINFDPMTRQIEELANMQKEMSFDEIVQGMQRERAAMEAMTPARDAANAAIAQQQNAVDALTRSRDALQRSYDAENDKLQQMKDTYQEINGLIGDIEQTLNGMGRAAGDALSAVGKKSATGGSGMGGEGVPSPGLQNFRDAEGGDFPDVGGMAQIGREGGMEDQSKMIDDFTAQMAAETAGMFGGFDMFGPIKDMWNQAWAWVQTNVMPVIQPVIDGVRNAFSSIGNPFDGLGDGISNLNLGDKINVVLDPIRGAIRSVVDWAKGFWNLFGEDIVGVFRALIDGVVEIWNKIAPEVMPTVESIIGLLKLLWTIVKPIVGLLGVVLLGAIKVLASVFSNTLGPVLNFLINTFGNVMQAVRGFINLIVGLVTGDLGLALNGLRDLFGAIFDQIVNIITSVPKIIWGIIKGLVEGIVDFFMWLWDVLVGHSIVPDIVDGIIFVFEMLTFLPRWIFEHVLKPIFDFFVSVGQWIWDKVVWIKDKVFEGFSKLGEVGGWINDNMIQPVKNFFTNAGDWIRDKAVWIKDKVYAGFDGLKAVGQWIQDNMIQPIKTKLDGMWDFIKDGLNRMIRGFYNIFNNVGSGIAGGINVGIKAINALIGGLNWIADHVPGIDFHINTIGEVAWSDRVAPQFAKGGQLPSSEVGGGFRTDGARAIVGEGRKGYPEYVIPTDPRYRGRAIDLLSSAARDIAPSSGAATRGRRGAPETGGWGFLGDAAGIADGAWDAAWEAGENTVGALRKGAVMAAMAAPLALFDSTIGNMPNTFNLKDMVMEKKNQIYNWMKGADSGVNDELAARMPPPPQMTATPSGGSWKAVTDYLNNLKSPPYYRITSTFRPGDNGYHGSNRAVDLAGRQGYDTHGAIYNALRPMATQLAELIYSGPGAVSYKNGKPHTYSAAVRADHHDHVHAALANGGIVRKTPGGILARIGEGRYDEAVVPLTPEITRAMQATSLLDMNARVEGAARRARSTTSTSEQTVNEYHFHGDLSFPNVTDGNDAKSFLDNLESLAG